jgi:hypothetical protein
MLKAEKLFAALVVGPIRLASVSFSAFALVEE